MRHHPPRSGRRARVMGISPPMARSCCTCVTAAVGSRAPGRFFRGFGHNEAAPSKPDIVSSNLTGRASTYVDRRDNAVTTLLDALGVIERGDPFRDAEGGPRRWGSRSTPCPRRRRRPRRCSRQSEPRRRKTMTSGASPEGATASSASRRSDRRAPWRGTSRRRAMSARCQGRERRPSSINSSVVARRSSPSARCRRLRRFRARSSARQGRHGNSSWWFEHRAERPPDAMGRARHDDARRPRRKRKP